MASWHCSHKFARAQRWWMRKPWERWQCVKCNMKTRRYDMVDRMGDRPVHPHMTVAVPGFNTVKRAKVDA